MSPTRFINNTVKARTESFFAFAQPLLVLSPAMMSPFISVGLSVTLLVAVGIFRSFKRQQQDRRYMNG